MMRADAQTISPEFDFMNRASPRASSIHYDYALYRKYRYGNRHR